MIPSVSTVLKGSLLMSVAALSSIASAAEAGTLGFSLGVKRNADGQCKETVDFERDLDILKPFSTTIRTYATSDCNTMKNIMPAIKKKGFQIILGVWPNDDEHFALEKEALTEFLPQYKDNVLAITVGSEAMYREEFTGEALKGRINEIRDLTAKLGAPKPVGTADSWNMLIEGDAVPAIEASDIILANAFSYWQGQTMANSSHSFYDDIMQALGRIQSIKGTTDVQFWVGETGWPTGGKNFDDSYPGVQNAAVYWKESICSMLNWGVNVFVFSAFDENWKPAEKENDVEKHWGVFLDNGKPKYDLSCAS